MLDNLRHDLAEYRHEPARLASVRVLAVVLHRAAAAAGHRVPLLGTAIKQVNHVLTGADIAWTASIGPGLRLFHPTGVVIGPEVVVGRGCVVQQGVTLGTASPVERPDDSPVIGDDVLLGAGCRVLGPIRVGDGAVVGANAVVLRSVDPGATAVGVPARVLEPQRPTSRP